MSLETKIELLTAAVVQLTIAIEQASNLKPIVDQVAERAQPPVAVTPALVPAAPPAAPIQMVAPAPVVAAPAAAMPPPPVFASAFVAPVGAVPFSDSQSLIAYTMSAYKQLGGVKGAGIQTVLTSMGVVNLTDVKPEMYAQFYAGIEALKAQG